MYLYILDENMSSTEDATRGDNIAGERNKATKSDVSSLGTKMAATSSDVNSLGTKMAATSLQYKDKDTTTQKVSYEIRIYLYYDYHITSQA